LIREGGTVAIVAVLLAILAVALATALCGVRWTGEVYLLRTSEKALNYADGA